MEDVKYKYYVVAMIDEDYPDEHYYVGVDPLAVELWQAVFLTTDIEKAAKVENAGKAVYLAEAAAKMFWHFGRAYIASAAVSVKWTAGLK